MKDFKHISGRSVFLDSLRGFTVILMIIFHFSFDLDFFGLIDIDILHAPFWYFFPRLIVFLFLFAVGIGLTLAHKNAIKWKPFFLRLALLVFWAIIISVTTYYFFHDNWIYFGTLHAISVVSVLSLPFINRPWTALAIGLALFIPSVTMDQTIPWFHLPHPSWDYISPFPWLGASLMGIFAAHKGIHQIDYPANKLVKSLNYLGQHSLVIYLIHQPILFGLLALFVKLKRS